jgi:formaldehyde-activating enzyme involved in methanogenesis
MPRIGSETRTCAARRSAAEIPLTCHATPLCSVRPASPIVPSHAVRSSGKRRKARECAATAAAHLVAEREHDRRIGGRRPLAALRTR